METAMTPRLLRAMADGEERVREVREHAALRRAIRHGLASDDFVMCRNIPEERQRVESVTLPPRFFLEQIRQLRMMPNL